MWPTASMGSMNHSSPNKVSCSPFTSGAFSLCPFFAAPLFSTLSQSTSSIGGGTTRAKLARLTASNPLPRRAGAQRRPVQSRLLPLSRHHQRVRRARLALGRRLLRGREGRVGRHGGGHLHLVGQLEELRDRLAVARRRRHLVDRHRVRRVV